MLKKEIIQINNVTASLDGDKMIIRIIVKNPEERTLYAYGSVRRMSYNNSSGKLKIFLHDHHLSEVEERQVSPHLREPHFVPLESGIESEIKIKLSKVVHRIRSAAERNNGDLLEELNIFEAKEIDVEIACQDTPFYYNPKMDNARQLKEWGKIISKAKFKISEQKHDQADDDIK